MSERKSKKTRLGGHMPIWARSRSQDERGIAMAVVALLGGFLVLLTVVVAARTMAENRAVGVDRQWEQAIHVAESGVDQALFDLNTGGTLTEVTLSASPTKDEVVAAAEVVALDPAEITESPEGDVVVVKDASGDFTYAVGYTPGFDAASKRVRVVKMEYVPEILVMPDWTTDAAFATGGDFDADSAGIQILDGSGASEAHIVAGGTVAIHQNIVLDGCASSYSTPSLEGINCPAEAPEPVLPVVEAKVLYPFSETDLCNDGTIRGGPAHPHHPNTTTEPCQGPLVSLQDWTSMLTGQGVRRWRAGNSAVGGVIYVDGGDVEGKLGNRQQSKVISITIIVASQDDSGNCVSDSGHIGLNAGSAITPHPSVGGLSLVAEGDIQLAAGSYEGLMVTHEQASFSGGTGAGGAVVAESACHSYQSPVGPESMITGGSTITYPGPYTTPFSTTVVTGRVIIDDIDEVGTSEL
jgi:hypothetical protein